MIAYIHRILTNLDFLNECNNIAERQHRICNGLVAALGCVLLLVSCRYANDALIKAVETQDCITTEKLLSEGGNLNIKNELGTPLLIIAVYSHNVEIVASLLIHGADPDCSVPIARQTSIFEAARSDDLAIARLLVDYHADINFKESMYNSTPLHLAAQYGSTNVLSLLITRGANVNAQDDGGYTPLMLAVQDGSIESVSLLLNSNADCSIKSTDDWTALHNAAYRGNLKVVKLLVESGADVNANTCEEYTAYDIAKEKDYNEIADYLSAVKDNS